MNAEARFRLTGIGVLGVAILVVVSLTTAPALRAQSAERFDVVSVRRVEIPDSVYGVRVFPTTGSIATGRIAYRGTWLEPLIAQAFGVRLDQVSGPEWLRTSRYDIVANIPKGTTPEQFTHMLGNLLVDRFHLRFHIGATTRDVYALRVAKSGPKFKPTARRADVAGVPGSMGTDAQGCPIVSSDYQGMIGRAITGGMCWTAQDVPIMTVANWLQGPAARPVVDETHLTGNYDFTIHLEWRRRAPDADTTPDPAPTVFTAVEEQLGLKLESTTRSFPQLIIDSIDREPTEN